MKYSFALLAAIVAVDASPFPQAVTGAISPTAAAPAGCTGSYPRSFGIVNMNITATGSSGARATQASDGQPGAGTAISGAVTQISDAQPQAPTAVSAVPVSQIGDGQVSKRMILPKPYVLTFYQIQGGKTQMMMPVTQIADGQVQGPRVIMSPASQISGKSFSILLQYYGS